MQPLFRSLHTAENEQNCELKKKIKIKIVIMRRKTKSDQFAQPNWLEYLREDSQINVSHAIAIVN